MDYFLLAMCTGIGVMLVGIELTRRALRRLDEQAGRR